MFQYIKNLLDPPITTHRIFFLHIAKCGGTSISEAIMNCYKPWQCHRSNAVVKLNVPAGRFAAANTIGTGNDVRRDLLNYMISLPEVKCIVGHFHYSHAAFEAYRNEWNHITVLRNPIDRWFSHYFYNHYKDGDYSKYKINASLENFIETEKSVSFGRAYVDEVTEDIEKKEYDITALTELAIDRYRSFSLVGCVEDLSEFSRQFEVRFSKKLKIKHLNKTSRFRNKDYRKDISDDICERVSEICQPDIHLYNQVLGRNLTE